MNDKPNEGGNPLFNTLNTMNCNRECNRYNGWTNYETWVYMLHITNECDPLRHYFEQLSTMDEYEFAKYLKNECADMEDELNLPPIFLDLLNASISEVDFQEIAESIFEDYRDSIEEEQE